ncbi:hypothetical protein PoB_005214900 [Plakobranchus ocellatus]|uniref:Uncharacterized protein n=1 Tax=Plakobranchus ocellatus TaxID=259542 RepID=A0AAV4C3C2_9GAST|nr:hypothetical protein PoB_005214900 [Plakobranchus ocellatus]
MRNLYSKSQCQPSVMPDPTLTSYLQLSGTILHAAKTTRHHQGQIPPLDLGHTKRTLAGEPNLEAGDTTSKQLLIAVNFEPW